MHRHLIAAAAVLVLAGCGGSKDASKSNFKAAIQTYLDSTPGACIPLPSEKIPFKLAKTGDRESRAIQADALVEAGFLTRRDAEIVPTFSFSDNLVPGFEYDLSEEGKKKLVKNAFSSFGKRDGFCAGKYEVVDVTSFTEPSDAFGIKESRVNYKYKIENPASWSSSPGIQKAYAEFAQALQGETTQRAVLIATSDGWMHEELFRAKSK